MRKVLIALLFVFLPLAAPASAEVDLGAPAWEGARVGLVAIRVGDGAVLLAVDADTRYVPASVLKVVTAAAALEALGPDHRFETRVLAGGPVVDGVLRGDLVLQGGGDPTLSDEDLAALAGRVDLRGVEGDLVLDAAALPGPPWGPGWAWEDVPLAFSAEVSGLTVDSGQVRVLVEPGEVGSPPRVSGGDLRNLAVTGPPGADSTWDVLRLPGRPGTWLVGTMAADEEPVVLELSVAQPALRAGERFRSFLEFPVGPVVEGRAEPGAPLAAVASEPLHEILARGLAESHNLVFEAVYRSIPDVAAVVPLDPASYRMVDGSGLSRYNLVTPRQVATVLAERPALAPLLPAPGEGTLATRLAGLPVRAKTGSMGGISSLAGYLWPDDPDRTVAFALLSNGFLAPGREVKAAEDAVVRDLIERFGAADSRRLAPP